MPLFHTNALTAVWQYFLGKKTRQKEKSERVLPKQWRIDPIFKFTIFEGSISQCLIRAKIVSKSFMQHVDECIAADFFFERQLLNQQNQLAPSTLKDLPSTLKELHLSTTVFSFHSILSKFLSKSFVISNQNSGY